MIIQNSPHRATPATRAKPIAILKALAHGTVAHAATSLRDPPQRVDARKLAARTAHRIARPNGEGRGGEGRRAGGGGPMFISPELSRASSAWPSQLQHYLACGGTAREQQLRPGSLLEREDLLHLELERAARCPAENLLPTRRPLLSRCFGPVLVNES